MQTIIYCLPFITIIHGLKLITTPQISRIYTDKGTGARMGITVYGPELSTIPNGYYMVGMSAVASTNAAGNKQMLFLVNPESDSSAIVNPTGFHLIWNDRGSGGDKDGSFWSAQCPAPYVALGDVAVGSHNSPSEEFRKKFACIHYRYIFTARLGSLIWNDRDSGADTDISVWETENIPNYPGKGLVGFFKANNRYSKPDVQVFGLPAIGR